ncbi:hypothetical protein [Cribrihabitans neustonicus]|uniref:hypothetical protein n=1 Tax=Cribrihabitans neustonicus TaxID=1429085 RepID=UPI003B58C4BD
MTWRALAIAAALAVAGPVQAQTIVARSGEHGSFSRLVMRLPDGADWSLTQSGRTATLNLDAPAAVFDTSRVFNLIPRTRLQALEQAAPGQPLRMQLGCECDLRSFVQRDGYLVIDIRDGKNGPEREPAEPEPRTAGGGILPLISATPAASGYRFNLPNSAIADARQALGRALSSRSPGRAAAAPAPVAPAPAAAPPPAQPASGAQQAQLGAVLPLSPAAAAISPKPAEAAGASVAVPTAGLLMDLEESERAAAVRASEQRLLQQLGRAANQGLLTITGDAIANAVSPDGLDPMGRANRPLDPLGHIAVTSAIDRETGLMPDPVDASAQAEHCLPASAVAVQNWGSDQPFSQQVGPLRSALVREFDDVNPAGVMALARIYLYFGFGAEARSLMELLPEARRDPQALAILEPLSLLLDGVPLPEGHPFAGQQTCDGNSALWGALADGALRKSANTDAIQQSFAQLPTHLRVHLGPRLSTMFAQAGEHHMAEAVLRSVGRTGVEDVPEINLAEAALAELEGDTERLAEELTSEVAERTGNAPAALIELVELSYKERKALTPDVPDLVASYELENRETPLGGELRQAQIAALALTGQFDDAFQEVEKLSRRDGPAARAQALEPLMTLLAERADDVRFLQYALVFSAQASAAEAAPVAPVVARRLLDLGFAEQAQMLLNKLALEPGNETRRLMMAEAALALGKPHRALVELMGLDGSEANRLRAEALWRNGEYGRAGEYLLAEQQPDAAARGFWHSQDLDAIGTIEPAAELPFGQVASVTSRIGETAEDPEGLTPLAHARALVESSEGTRGSIEDLLNKVGKSLKPETETQ